jgi:hypothetical protein
MVMLNFEIDLCNCIGLTWFKRLKMNMVKKKHVIMISKWIMVNEGWIMGEWKKGLGLEWLELVSWLWSTSGPKSQQLTKKSIVDQKSTKVEKCIFYLWNDI